MNRKKKLLIYRLALVFFFLILVDMSTFKLLADHYCRRMSLFLFMFLLWLSVYLFTLMGTVLSIPYICIHDLSL